MERVAREMAKGMCRHRTARAREASADGEERGKWRQGRGMCGNRERGGRGGVEQ